VGVVPLTLEIGRNLAGAILCGVWSVSDATGFYYPHIHEVMRRDFPYGLRLTGREGHNSHERCDSRHDNLPHDRSPLPLEAVSNFLSLTKQLVMEMCVYP
jgi:hypothetical protein